MLVELASSIKLKLRDLSMVQQNLNIDAITVSDNTVNDNTLTDDTTSDEVPVSIISMMFPGG